jgi:hypothetical protein
MTERSIQAAETGPRWSRTRLVPALAALGAVIALGTATLMLGLPRLTGSASPSAGVSTASAPAALGSGGPTPAGMLPLGPTKSLNQPPAPCEPGIPGEVGAPELYEAVPLDYSQAQSGLYPAAVAEVVDYSWGGHRPLAAGTLHVTIPDRRSALQLDVARMRLVVATSNGICFAAWRAAARSVSGYDGAQDAGAWASLGEGAAEVDAVVVGGLPEGDWIVHVHLAYSITGAAATYSSESYARVVVGGHFALAAASVAAPSPAADCAAGTPPPGHTPPVALIVDGAPSSTAGTLGSITIGNSAGEPSAIPADVVSMKAGQPFRVRTTDGSCGNDWSGLFFFAAPDALPGPVAGLSGLPSNNGGPPDAATPPLVGAISGWAPAPGEWIVGAIFFFGGSNAVDYYWRISVH